MDVVESDELSPPTDAAIAALRVLVQESVDAEPVVCPFSSSSFPPLLYILILFLDRFTLGLKKTCFTHST